MYVVYGLVNPLTRQVFYVGMTKDLYERYTQHLRMEGNNEAKNGIILSLKKRHIVPEIWTLAVAQAVDEAKRLEAFWIEKERLLQQPLTNQTHWTGYPQMEWEREQLEYIARQIYRERKPLKGLLGFIYKRLEPYLIGKVLYDARFAGKQEGQFNKETTDPMALSLWNDIRDKLLNGEEPSAIVKSYSLPYGRATQELSAVVQMMAQQIDAELAEREEEDL